MQPGVPIPTVHLFPILDEKLIELLRSLSPDEWHRPTIAPRWQVKDIAAHLLDVNIRALSMTRDKLILPPPAPIDSYRQLVNYLNDLNAVWVEAAKRISPALLIDLLSNTGKQYSDFLLTLDPFAEAIFPVAWAGETVSSNWFHIAREYTERFHHQQQIREATGKPGIMTKELYYPFIDTFLQGLPYAYRNVSAEDKSSVQITVTTDAGGVWYLQRNNNKWRLSKHNDLPVAATVAIDPDTAWKLFSKGMTPDAASRKVEITGDRDLGSGVLQLIAVMA